MVKPFVGSGRQREGGLGATHKKDFNAHVTGGGYVHPAYDIRMAPQVTALNGVFASPTVQGTLEKMGSFINGLGQGFVTIDSDGYGETSSSNFPVGSTDYPTVTDAFNAAFLHPRIINGGIILVKAGIYRVFTTINVPAGITILGEMAGTIMIGETTEVPMFKFLRSVDRFDISPDGVTSNDPLDKSQLFNITLVDNLDGYAASGAPTMQTVPMVQLERGSQVICDKVTFLGKMGTIGGMGRVKTKSVFEYTTGSADESTLFVDKCTADGFKIFCNFNTPGTTDKLSIQNCKVRVFGTENSGLVTDYENQCFINTTTNGEISICNNFFDANFAGTFVSSIVNIQSGNARGKIVNNSGDTITTVNTLGVGTLLHVSSPSTTTTEMALSGNSYDKRHFNNQWFMTVGDGVFSVGDFTGQRSIDLLMRYYTTANINLNTVIVNFGIYRVNGVTDGSNFLKANLIGSKIGISPGASYPQIELDIVNTVTTDALGNNLLTLGGHVESIHFKSLSGTSFHSVKPSNDATVVDCIFENVTLSSPTGATSSVYLTGVDFLLNIKNCMFLQTGLFDDNISILLNSGHSIVEGCTVKGNGYALAAGTFTGYTHTAPFTPPVITIKDSIFNMTAFTISDNSPFGSGENRYMVFNDSTARVILDNCQIHASDDMSTVVTPIDAGLVGSFDKFIEISADTITINNCRISGPDQLFTDTIDYAIPVLFLEPRKHLVIENTNVVGALPCQISGTNAFNANFAADNNTVGVFIDNSNFYGYGSSTVTQTVLDIDLDANNSSNVAVGVGIFPTPKIVITNCGFNNNSGLSNVDRVRHTNITGSDYDNQGIVQIYANGYDVSISNNVIEGVILASAAILGTYVYMSGLLVNAFDDTSGGAGVDGHFNSVVRIANNTIKCNASAVGLDIASAVWVKSPVLSVIDNVIGMRGGILATTTVCLYIENPLGTTGENLGSVQGNLFTRYGTSLAGGYVIVDSISERDGIIVDNVFDEITYDGSFTSIIDGYGWITERNKNQTKSITIPGSAGAVGVHDFTLGVTEITLAGSFGAVSSSRAIIGLGATTTPVKLRYDDAGTPVFFAWQSDLSILPPNVRIIQVSVVILATAMFDTAGTLTVQLRSSSDTTGVSGSLNLTGSTGGTVTVNVTNYEDFITNINKPILDISLTASDTSTAIVTELTSISITYRW